MTGLRTCYGNYKSCNNIRLKRDAIPNLGSSALLVLSNKEEAARAGWRSQHTSAHCVRDDFLGESSLNAFLHWFLGESPNG